MLPLSHYTSCLDITMGDMAIGVWFANFRVCSKAFTINGQPERPCNINIRQKWFCGHHRRAKLSFWRIPIFNASSNSVFSIVGIIAFTTDAILNYMYFKFTSECSHLYSAYDPAHSQKWVNDPFIYWVWLVTNDFGYFPYHVKGFPCEQGTVQNGKQPINMGKQKTLTKFPN